MAQRPSKGRQTGSSDPVPSRCGASPEGPTPVALTCFYKNNPMTPKDDRERAEARMKTYEKAHSENPSPS